MKRFLSVIMAVVLVTATGGLLVNGTMASFFDTEASSENYMCAGTVNLEIGSGALVVEGAWPCEWYSKEHMLINAGTLDAIAKVHICNLVCIEDAPGAGVATREPESVAEEGGWIGNVLVEGLGVDKCDIAEFIEVRLWYDSDDDGILELVVEGMLSDIVCNEYVLGVIPGSLQVENNTKGGGWGSYFEYTIGSPKLTLPLMIGQNTNGGTVSVETDGSYLRIKYDTYGWEMADTAVYVGADPPEKLAPGSFPYKHDPVTPPLTEDSYDIPLVWDLGTKIYIAAHATGTDGETAWAKGQTRRFMMELHFPDIPENYFGLDYFPDTSPCDHWPTNAYQGDSVTFDIEFLLNGISTSGPPNGKK
ncbi:MAG TPA: hypothetical protein G4O07_07840 [Dehalococcoidia bacterium]|nr:hypothetical protein [Dehalococcoidia bacterium]